MTTTVQQVTSRPKRDFKIQWTTDRNNAFSQRKVKLSMTEIRKQWFKCRSVSDACAFGEFLPVVINLKQRDAMCQTHLCNAVVVLNYTLVEYLLDNGANPSLRDQEGWTALRYLTAIDFEEDYLENTVPHLEVKRGEELSYDQAIEKIRQLLNR